MENASNVLKDTLLSMEFAPLAAELYVKVLPFEP